MEMKTSQALYDAIEAVEKLRKAMVLDLDDSDLKAKGLVWIRWGISIIDQVYRILEGVRDSLNEGD